MLRARVPPSLNEHVRSLCDTIVKGAVPDYVRVECVSSGWMRRSVQRP